MTKAKTRLSSGMHSHIQTVTLNAPVERGSRGRNGVFTARSLQVYSRPSYAGNQPAMLSIEAFSVRSGRHAPIALGLSPEDALILAEELLCAVRAITPDAIQEVIDAALPVAP